MRLLVIAVWLSIGAFRSAFAADLPQAAPPQVPTFVPAPPPYSWSGFYLGAELGYGIGSTRKDFSNGTTTGDFAVDGVIGGGTVGYNQQWGNFVAGLEGDFSGSAISGSASCPNPAFTCETNTHWLATLRPRIGYGFDRWMPYVTGGLAVGDVNVRSFSNISPVPGVDFTKTVAGWTVGAGIEANVNFNWSLKAEYLYVGLADANGPSNISSGVTTTTKLNENIIRAGLNYAFR